MDLGIRGKKAILTRATAAVARAAAELLAAEGVDIAFCDADASAVQALATALKAKQINVIGTALDVGDGDAYKAWIESSVRTLGGCDIFIASTESDAAANSGGATPTAGEEWKTSFDREMMQTMRGCEALLPHFKTAGGGAIVVIGDSRHESASLAHAAMQAALITYSKQLSQFAGRNGVRSNLVASDRASAKAADVAKTVVFLASPAASLITGARVARGQ